MTDAPKCKKCGRKMKLREYIGHGDPTPLWVCSDDSRDCAIAELERQLEDSVQTVANMHEVCNKLEDERDAALKARDEAADQVAVLRDALEHETVCRECGEMGCGSCANCTSSGALSSTSTLAAQRKREIQREAQEKFLDTIRSLPNSVLVSEKSGASFSFVFAKAHLVSVLRNSMEAHDAPHF